MIREVTDEGVRRGIAYHEAGHAVIGTRLGLEVLGMDIVPDGAGGRGHTRFATPWPGFNPRGRLTDPERDVVVRFAVTFMGGVAAEGRLGVADPGGSGFDELDVWERWIGLLSSNEEERRALRAEYLARAVALLDEPGAWPAIVAVGDALLRVSSLTGADVRTLLSPADGDTPDPAPGNQGKPVYKRDDDQQVAEPEHQR